MKLKWVMIAVFAGLTLFALPCQAQWRSSVREFFFVQGVVTSIEKGEGMVPSRSEQRITHVFSGPSTLLGQTFSFDARDKREITGIGDWAFPTRVGQKGLWQLEMRTRNGPLTPFFSSYSLRFPVLDDAPFYVDALQYVEAMRNYDMASVPDKTPLLKDYALDSNDFISVWAIGRLSHAADAETVAFLRSCISKYTSRSGGQQVALDEALTLCDKEWPNSTERFKYFKRLVTSDSAEQVSAALWRIDFATQEGNMTGPMAFALALTGTANPSHPQNQASRWLYLIGSLGRRKSIPYQQAFDFLLNKFVQSQDTQTRIGVIYGWAQLELTEAERTTLRQLPIDASDEKLRQSMTQLLNHRP